jgi:long-chain fatty acid transport protein
MRHATIRVLRPIASALFIGSAAIGAAHATEGYSVEGVSPKEIGTGGAGVADPRDALTIANNPAGLVDIDPQINMGISAFFPDRQYTGTNTTFIAPGTHVSHDPVFPVPAMALAMPIDANSAFGIGMYANGGMNTHYVTSASAPSCARSGGVGVFCGGSQAGVNLNQAFISVGYARKFGPFSIGIAPVMAVQMFSAYGLGSFASISSNSTALTDRGVSWSVGGGLRVGGEWKVTPKLRLGLAGITPIWSTDFSRYNGLFANHGNFDIPASITAGVAYDVLPTLTLLLDYKHIFYSDVPAIADSSAYTGTQLGASGGPGFGWRDVDVISVGAEWRVMPNITLRAGYAHNTNPIRSTDVTFNILAPGIVTDQISAGMTYDFNKQMSFDLAMVFAPRHDTSGAEVLPGYGTIAGSNIDLAMSQFQVTLGATYKFGMPSAPAPALQAKY